MLGINASLSDLIAKIGSGYDTVDSLRDLAGAIASAVEDGTCRITCTVDADFFSLLVEHKDEVRYKPVPEPESDSTAVEG